MRPPLLQGGVALVAVGGGAAALVGATPADVTVASAALSAQAAPLAARPTLEPVVTEPDTLDAGALVKAVQQQEQAIRQRVEQERRDRERQEKERQEKERARTDCGIDTSGLGAVRAHVRKAATLLGCRFGEPTMYGVAGRGGASDHPGGLAVDFMVDRATGDALAQCALDNRDALGISYVIWRQRINYGSGWQAMEDRGGVTANHFDHVHVSFGSRAGGTPALC